MKPFGSLKIWMPLLGLGAALVLAPQSRAQAEVAPDHFDGTDSWAVASAAKTPSSKASQSSSSSAQAANKKRGAASASQVASAKNAADSQRPELVAVQDKRKVPARKKKNQ
jgi:hypothetical protein